MSKTTTEQDLKIPKRMAIISNAAALILAGVIIVLTYLGVFPFQDSGGIYRILPGNILLDFILIWTVSIIVAVGIYYVTPKVAMIVIKFHKVLSGGVYDYYFQERDKDREHSRHFGKLIIPALTTLGLAFTLTNMVGLMDVLFITENFDTLPPEIGGPLSTSMPMFFSVLLFATVISIIFAASWLLEDLGIICVRRNAGTGMTVDIEGIGNWYIALLKGFAGISAMLAYFFIFAQMFTWFGTLPTATIDVPAWYYLLLVLMIILSPLMAFAPVSISYLFYNMTEEKNHDVLNQMLIEKGLKHVRIDVVEVDVDDR
ncbi:MAG: hypothetical protein ACTSV2_06805 [Candidatus Thorarchaeota archaeon]